MSDPVRNAAQGIIEVWVTPSPADLRVLVRKNPDRAFLIILTVFSRIGAFTLGSGLMALGLWALDGFSPNILENVVAVMAGGIVGLLAFRLLVERVWRQRNRKALLDQARPVHVTGDGRELTIADGDMYTRIAYSSIDRLIRTPTHLVPVKGSRSLVALPKAAFDRPETFDAFAAFLEGIGAAPASKLSIAEKTP